MLTIVILGSVYLSATVAVAVMQPRLGSPVFFALAALAAAAYIGVLAFVSRTRQRPRRAAFMIALLFAVAFRVPLAIPPVNEGNDMFRYVWDGRVQRLGYNPYAVLPADPAMAATHTDGTRAMPSRRWRTPYPPAAQLFFRLVVSIRDSAHAMKLALMACELLTIFVVWRWLLATGRSEWLTLAYAWNPLVVLEVAHSGHIDALAALWIVVSAHAIARGRRTLATLAFVFACATKLLPIVLTPLLWRRISVRDGLIGAAVGVLLYLPFAIGANPNAAVDNVVAHIRFNGPVFQAIAALAWPQFAAGLALLMGLSAAAWARVTLEADHPAAWAWPMALALAGAPVIYPWYLLPLTPFLLARATAPLIAWTLSVMTAYVVWEMSFTGAPWMVPTSVLALEYGLVLAAVIAVMLRRSAPTGPVAPVALD